MKPSVLGKKKLLTLILTTCAVCALQAVAAPSPPGLYMSQSTAARSDPPGPVAPYGSGLGWGNTNVGWR
jgi:hypothetical protein